MKYRIVTNGLQFKVQREGLFNWSDCLKYDGIGSYAPLFAELPKAEEFMQQQLMVSSPWTVVQEG